MGEHFGAPDDASRSAVRYDGGSVREPFLGTTTLEPGMVFHQTALYELIYMVVLFLLLTYVLYGRKAAAAARAPRWRSSAATTGSPASPPTRSG